MKLISIITINYNDKAGLERTIKSVREQCMVNFEHIIIDGASSDGSTEVIELYKDGFSYWISEPDRGIYEAMNKGIKAAKGAYLLFLNSGDMLSHSHILTRFSCICNDQKDIYYGDLHFVGDSIKTRVCFPPAVSFDYFYNNGYLPHPSSFIKKSLFDRLGMYDESYSIVADWDFFIRAICTHNATYKHINEVVTDFDLNGISSKSEYHELKLEEKSRILSTHFSAYLIDYRQLSGYKKLFKLTRFQLLEKLESNSTAQKLNSIWLRFLNRLFKPRK